MYNVLLDPLPAEWNGHQIDPSFQNGIQIMQIMADQEISEREKAWLTADLLFFDAPETLQEVFEAVVWFLNDWNHDHPDGKGNNHFLGTSHIRLGNNLNKRNTGTVVVHE